MTTESKILYGTTLHDLYLEDKNGECRWSRSAPEAQDHAATVNLEVQINRVSG